MKKLFGIAAMAALAWGVGGVSPALAACDTEDSTLLITTGVLPYGTWVSVYEGGPYGYQVENQFSLLTGCSDGAIDSVVAAVGLIPLP